MGNPKIYLHSPTKSGAVEDQKCILILLTESNSTEFYNLTYLKKFQFADIIYHTTRWLIGNGRNASRQI